MSPVKRIPLSADHGNPVRVVGNRRGAVLRGTRPSRQEARTQAGQHHRGCAGCADRRHGDIHDAASDGGAIKRSIHADGVPRRALFLRSGSGQPVSNREHSIDFNGA